MATKEKSKEKVKDKQKKDEKHRPRKTTKLHEACISGDLDLVDACLIKHKSWLNTPNEEGRYPIHLACLHGQQAVVERLLKAAAFALPDVLNQIEDRPGRWCVLHYAAHSKNKELFFFLSNLPDIKGTSIVCCMLRESRQSPKKRVLFLAPFLAWHRLQSFEFIIECPSSSKIFPRSFSV
jgi:hypothetical protein